MSVRRAIILLVASCCAFCLLAPVAAAGEVAFDTPASDNNFYNSAAAIPDFTWNAFGGLIQSSCVFARTAPQPAELFSGNCSAGLEGGPLGLPIGPGLTRFLWLLQPLVGIDGSYEVSGSVLFNDSSTAEFRRGFTLDTQLPRVVIGGPTGFTASRTPEFSFSIDDANPGSTRCGVDASGPGDNVNLSTCLATPLVLPSMPDGPHTFWAVHTDLAGNTGFVNRPFTVDTTPPQIEISGVETGQVLRQNTLNLSVGALDAGAGVGSLLCSWDGTAAANCSDQQFREVELVDDVYHLLAIAVDKVGNVSTRSVTFSVETETEDAETPDGSLEVPKSGSFKIKRGPLKARRHYRATFTASFALPGDASRDDCEGSASLRVKRGSSQLGKAKATFTASGRTCTASGVVKIAKKHRGKKLTVSLDYASGPFAPFTLKSKSMKF